MICLNSVHLAALVNKGQLAESLLTGKLSQEEFVSRVEDIDNLVNRYEKVI